MARVLAVAQVRVPAARRAEYLTILAELDMLGRPRGRHLWAFRNGTDPELFLECSESSTVDAHRAVAVQDGREAVLEGRLRELTARDAAAAALWHEVPLPALTT